MATSGSSPGGSPAADREEPQVAWAGPVPAALADVERAGGVERARADVVHVVAADGSSVRELHRDRPSTRLVLHLPAETQLDGRAAARAANRADLVVVETDAQAVELVRRRPELQERLRLLRPPLDLDWWAPEAQLLETPLRGRSLRRFRRFHRLAGPTVLFAGPYTERGGLDLALEAVFRLREVSPDVRLTAIPIGQVDRDYLDRIERRALALGHHGVVEWSPAEDEVPFWYAVADVVCSPSRAPLESESVLLAAAAARRWVGSTCPAGSTYVETLGAIAIPPGDLDALANALSPLIQDVEAAHALGEEARRVAERELTAAGVAERLRRLWREALSVAPSITEQSSRSEGRFRLRPLKSLAR